MQDLFNPHSKIFPKSTHPSIKGTSRNTFLTTSIRSSECTATHIEIKFTIIVQKHKPYILKPSVRLRRRMAFLIPEI